MGVLKSGELNCQQTAALTSQLLARDDRPNLLVFGVGHSGTSIVAKILRQIGWNLGDQVDGFAEHVGIRKLNGRTLRKSHLPMDEALKHIGEMPQPWAIKDPRFVLTLGHWISVFEQLGPAQRPVLVYLTRDATKVKRTYEAYGEVKNGEPFMYRRTVDELLSMARNGFEEWPFRKIHLKFEQVIEAAGLFNVNRAKRRDT